MQEKYFCALYVYIMQREKFKKIKIKKGGKLNMR